MLEKNCKNECKKMTDGEDEYGFVNEIFGKDGRFFAQQRIPFSAELS